MKDCGNKSPERKSDSIFEHVLMFLEHFLFSIGLSFISMTIVFVLWFLLLFIEGELIDMGATISFAMFCIIIFYLPINLCVLLIIQFTKILPNIISSRKMVIVESCTFLILSLISQHLFFPKSGLGMIIACLFVIILTLLLRKFLINNETKSGRKID